MLLHFIFLNCIFVTMAYKDIFTAFNIKETGGDPPPETTDASKLLDAHRYPNCYQFSRTGLSPFVIILLLKTSGRFCGMGSIIDKTTVLTAVPAVEISIANPTDMLVLAGRLSPWWGDHSQVKHVREILVHNDAQMALVKTSKPFNFCKGVAPVKLLLKKVDNLEPQYDKFYAIFGIPRSNFDVPGDLTPKSTFYELKVESGLFDSRLEKCIYHFKDSNHYKDLHICTIANGTYCWGCIGSPTMAFDKKGNLWQIAVLSKVSIQEEDLYHRHTRIGPFANWLKSQTFITYKDE